MALVTYDSTLREWENVIRVKLKVANPALLKSGALGILANYLAGIKYDALQFYSKAFQEMNVGLAQDFNSMLYHSTIYGTDLEFAVPATLASSLVIPEIRLSNIEELVYTVPRYTNFSDSNGINFLYESEIKMTITNTGLTATSWNPTAGTQKLTVSTAPNPNIPNGTVYLIHNAAAEQYNRSITNYIVPEYDVGSTFSFSIGIENVTNIKDLYAWVNTGTELDSFQLASLQGIDPDNIEGAYSEEGANIVAVEIKYYKFDSSVRDQHLFLEIYENSLNFETGDGTHGSLMPSNSQLIVEVDQTLGENGNIPNSEYIINNIGVNEKYSDGTVERSYSTSLNGLSTSGSYSGKNIEQVDGIRENIFNQINIRDSIITENDYERVFKYQDIKPFVDAKFIDAKAFVFLFNVIHDNDQIVKTTSVNYKEADLLQNPFYPFYEYSGTSLISPFYYKHNGLNTVDAYIVDPAVAFSLEPTTASPNQDTIADYRVDLALTYEFQRSQSGMNGKSYIEITSDANPAYEYHFYASWLGTGAYIPLNADNNFKYEINTLYTDAYCIVREDTTSCTLQVRDPGANDEGVPSADTLVAEFQDTSTYNQLILKQSFFKYFQDLPVDAVPEDVVTTRDTLAYLDNYLSDVMSTTTDVVELNQQTETETYLLRLPFISEDWFLAKPADEVYGIMDSYFIVDYVDDNVNYNTQLTQAFHNTIDIPSEYYPYLFEANTMPTLDTPDIDIEVEIFVNKDSFIVSKYETVFDFEVAVKIAIIKFMKEKEGFMIDFFETDLEKLLYNDFSPIIKNIKVGSPTMFRVNNSATIYNNLQENLSFQEVLDFVPPYFYYNYNDVVLNVSM